jgi:hypothetical protein
MAKFNFSGKTCSISMANRFSILMANIFSNFFIYKDGAKKIRTVFSNLYLKFKKKSQITLQIYNENTYHVESLVVEFLK